MIISTTQALYDPAVIGRTGITGVDVIVTHPSPTTTKFENAEGPTGASDFIFEVLTPP